MVVAEKVRGRGAVPARGLPRVGRSGWGIWAAIVGAYVAAAVFAPVFAAYEEAVRVDLRQALSGPRPGEWLGRDELGRPVAARVLWGARSSLTIAVAGVGLGAVTGTSLGMLSGLRQGTAVDGAITTAVDALLALPRILLALLVVAFLGQNKVALTVAVALSAFPGFARLARGATLRLTGQEFVYAALALGAGHIRILHKHIFPNILEVLLPYASLSLSNAILVIAALGFLGLGPPPPEPEWGGMLSTARTYLWAHPHLLVVPGTAVALLAVSLSVLSDNLMARRSRARPTWIRLQEKEGTRKGGRVR